jgi:hypothetical protein
MPYYRRLKITGGTYFFTADDHDYPRRWSLIKATFSRGLPSQEQLSRQGCQARERHLTEALLGASDPQR